MEDVINNQFRKGYRLLSMSTSNGGSKGFAGGDRIQATLVFEKMNIEELYLKMQGSSEGKHRSEDYIPINLSATNEEEDAQVSQTIIEPPQQTQLDTSDGASIGKSSTFTKISDYTIRCDLCGLTQSFTKRQCCRCGATFTTENNNPGF